MLAIRTQQPLLLFLAKNIESYIGAYMYPEQHSTTHIELHGKVKKRHTEEADFDRK